MQGRSLRVFLLLGLVAASCAASAPPPAPPLPASSPAALAVERIAPSRHYPLARCVVTEKPLDAFDDRRALRYQGHEVQVCCATCQRRFQDEPETFMARYRAWMEELPR